MNNLKKAEAFGEAMGKMAADGLLPQGPPPPVPGAGGQQNSPPISRGHSYLASGGGNPAGRLPSATTTPSVPWMPDPADYRRFNRSNYTGYNWLGAPSIGESRLNFHKDLGKQLEEEKAFEPWGARMGDIAQESSSYAPIRHYQLSHPTELGLPPNDPRATQPHSRAGFPFLREEAAPKRGKQYVYVPSSGLTPGMTKMLPKTMQDKGFLWGHEVAHGGYQDMGPETGIYFTDKKGKPITSPAINPWSFEAPPWYNEAGVTALEGPAVANEVAQSARAFHDTTGKPMKGSYSFSPNVQMDHSEMADRSRKGYTPADANSPAGQIFFRRILEDKK